MRLRIWCLIAAPLVTGLACDSTHPLPPAVFVAPAVLTLEDGQTGKLTATLRNPRTRTVTWSSANPAVARVDPIGTVTAVANGQTTVTVRMTDDTTVFTTASITVSGPPVASLALSPSTSTVYVGYARQLTAQLAAADGRPLFGRAVAWTTADAGVATVSSGGVVRGRGAGGPIVITATTEGRSATARVRVAHEAESCPVVTPIAIGDRADGNLASGDCEFRLDGSYVDVYELRVPVAATVQIDMVSAEVNAIIGLFDAAGRYIAEDDDSGGDRNARLVRQIGAGIYRIWANTTTGGATGHYTLSISTP